MKQVHLDRGCQWKLWILDLTKIKHLNTKFSSPDPPPHKKKKKVLACANILFQMKEIHKAYLAYSRVS